MTTVIKSQLPFEIADLYLLSPEGAKATLERFEWLRDFAMHAPKAATLEEGRLLFRAIEVLEEITRP